MGLDLEVPKVKTKRSRLKTRLEVCHGNVGCVYNKRPTFLRIRLAFQIDCRGLGACISIDSPGCVSFSVFQA